MSQLQLNNSVSDEILADSAHRHLIELDMTRQKNPTNHGLIFFSRQSVLIKYFPNYRQNVFDELMKFAVLEPMMDEKQRCVYYTVQFLKLIKTYKFIILVPRCSVSQKGATSPE